MQAEARDGMKRASRDSDPYLYQYLVGKFHAFGKVAGILKKQKEQKPAEYLDKDKVYAIMKKLHDLAFSQRIPIDSDEYKKIGEITSDVRSLLDYPIEQKPAEWSEDWREEDIQTRFAFYTYKDEDGVLYLSNVFVEEASRNHGFGTKILIAAEKVAEIIGATTISLKVKQDSPANAWYRKNGYGYVAFEDGYDWLEKNLEYMKPNKQEWSEEDEDMLNSCISSIEEAKENRYAYKETDGDTSYDHEIAWLKSLRNRVGKEFLQPHWKPSEEQPEVFDTVAFQKGVQEGRRLEREDALTVADIEKLHTFLYAVKNNKQGAFTFTRLSDEQYEEVLRRFNKTREQ